MAIGSKIGEPSAQVKPIPVNNSEAEKSSPDGSANAKAIGLSDTKSTENSSSPTTSATQMKNHELLAYFQPSDAQMYTTCNDEKGPSDDYFEGKLIPMNLVEKYDLFQFNMSPPLRLKYKLPNALVTVKGGTMLSYQKQRIMIYTVGIGMESEDAPVDEGVDTRALVLNSEGEITSNYFVAGYVRREGREEQSVCRKLAFKGNEIVLTLIEEETTNNPSHLRLELVETRDL
jgi:hypothetical protein